MPYPGLLHPEPLPLRQATADPRPTGGGQTQCCLSLYGVSGSWCTQGLFEPSKYLWQIWGLILNMISPLLPSCWGFSFALGLRVSPLPLDLGYLLKVAPALHSRLLLRRKVMTKVDSILKSRDITLPTKVSLVKDMVFLVVMYGCEIWTLKEAEH